MESKVRDNKQEGRFELALEGGRMAYVVYEEAGEGVLALTHTEVPAEFEGKGVGGALVKGALELARGENLKIVPTCRFVSVYLRRHPEYQELVA
jgi:predicted GNAT family acetyltransferase